MSLLDQLSTEPIETFEKSSEFVYFEILPKWMIIYDWSIARLINLTFILLSFGLVLYPHVRYRLKHWKELSQLRGWTDIYESLFFGALNAGRPLIYLFSSILGSLFVSVLMTKAFQVHLSFFGGSW
jgi:hypothetical protein